MKTTIAIVGELDPEVAGCSSIEPAIGHSARYLEHEVETQWISSVDADGIDLAQYGGVWLAAGARYLNVPGAMDLIGILRQNSIPCLGTCRGYQYMILEFARNVLGHSNAGHEEDNPHGDNLFLTELPPASRKSRRSVELDEGTPISPAYPGKKALELFYGRFGVNPKIEGDLSRAGFVSMASEYSGQYRIAGIPKHPFFIGTLFLPQLRATRDSPHPIVTAFVKHALFRTGSNHD